MAHFPPSLPSDTAGLDPTASVSFTSGLHLGGEAMFAWQAGGAAIDLDACGQLGPARAQHGEIASVSACCFRRRERRSRGWRHRLLSVSRSLRSRSASKTWVARLRAVIS
jgi:hypothetical protein